MESDETDVEFVSHEVLESDHSERERAPPSKDRSLNCKTCGKKFSNHKDRKKHELIHLPGFPYRCTVCSYRGKTKHYLIHHMRKVHAARDIKCDFCPAVFIYQCKKDEHMRVHTGEKPYKCDYCPKTFRVSYSLKSHMLIHTDEKPFRCSFCDYACRDNSTLRKHQNNHMGLVKLFNCTICNKSFKHKWKLKEHISELHLQIDLRKHECLQCGKMFKSPTLVAVHAKQVHDRAYATKCPVCGKKVSNRYNLRMHLASHVDHRPYTCTQAGCNKAFKDRGTLKKHVVIHKPELHYPCKLCDMKFSRKHRLVKHLTQHEDRKKNVICDYCQVSFYTKNYLIQHIQQKHTVRQRYICDECGIRTTNKPGMILHLKYGHNSNDKECKICHSKFKRFEYLKNHYYRTHNVRYKMVKPYGKKKSKTVIDMKAEVKVKMEPVDEDFDQINLMDVEKEEIQEDCIEYSRSVLNEDIQACVLGSKGNIDEIEFDQFLVTHMFKKSKDEDDNLPQDVDPIELKKSKDTIEELLKKSEKKRLTEAKRNKIKALAKTKERRAKIEAKISEEKKEAEEDRKRRDEDYTARREDEEIVELEKLRVKYNERMKNISLDVFKKKENTKIKYFKAKTNQNVNINDPSEEDNDDISFAVKPSQNINNFGENSKINKHLVVIGDKANVNDDIEVLSGDNNTFVENNDENSENNNELVGENSNIDENKSNSEVIDINGELKAFNDEERRKMGETNEINDELATENSNIDENLKNSKHDSNGEPNYVNNEERIEFSQETDKIGDNNHPLPRKRSDTEINDEENNEKIEINGNKNDSIEENDGENTENDEVFDKNNKLSETNDEIGENNEIRRSNRKRKPNKIYEQEVNTPKHNKMSFKTHQCYVCFKLYSTKEELLDHCQIHFDVCSLKTLTKCPICDYVTPKSLSAHLLKKHDIHLKMPFNHIKERDLSDGSKYCYNADGTIIEVIPSVKILNKNAYIEIDKKNRERKDKSVTKTKLVRKGKEWIVEKEDIELKFDLLPQFDEKEYRKLKVSDNYIDRMKQIYKLAKKNNLKMAFPCFDCDKICQNLSALKLHNRKHQINPKPFRARGEVKKEKEKQKTKKVNTNFENRNAKPKPIKNRHKCDDELKKFYETNIRGGDIEFWQFLKIFNKMDRENITEFDELEERTDFGIHIKENTKDTKIINKNKVKNSKNNKPEAKSTIKRAKIDVTDTKNVTNTKNDTPIPGTSVKTAKIDLSTAKNNLKTGKIDPTAKSTQNITKDVKIDLTSTENRLNAATIPLTTAKNIGDGTKNFKISKNINKIAKPTYKRVVMISKEDYKKRIEAKNRLREKIYLHK